MQKETVEHVICEEGRFWREQRTRIEIDPTPALQKVFSKQAAFKSKNVIFIPDYGAVGMMHEPSTNQFWWTIPITFINLRCEFRTIKDVDTGGNYLSPKFIYNKDSSEAILIRWNLTYDTAKESVPRINLLVVTQLVNGAIASGNQYLIALDSRGNSYQLPLANLYEHLQLCCGDFESRGNSHEEVLLACIKQFENSQWNSDLYHASDEANTNNFFRLKPLKEGFETLQIKGDWTTLCKKRAVAQTSFIV